MIRRFDVGPRLSEMAIHNGTAYLAGQVPNDPSQDVIDYHYGAGGSQFSTQVYIIDVMFGHCGGSPGPAWIDQTSVTVNSGTVGMFIYPRPGRPLTASTDAGAQ